MRGRLAPRGLARWTGILLLTVGLAFWAPSLTAAAPRHPADAEAALASSHAVVTVQRPLTLGVSDAEYLLGAGSANSEQAWAKRARAEGITIVHVEAYWNQVAPLALPTGFQAADPTNPAYDWAELDPLVRTICREGFQVLITVQSAPSWAEGADKPSWAGRGTWEPNPADFGAFAQAIARRYSGSVPDPADPGHDLPRVRYWQAWNEPNLDFDLSPQWVEASRGHFVEESPGIYRQLLNAFYAGVKSVSPANVVLSAGTAPFGDDIGSVPIAQARTPPVIFDRDLLCLTASGRSSGCPDPAHFDALDHHPYGISPSTHALDPGDVSVPDIGKLTRLLSAAGRDHLDAPPGVKSVWITEVNWNTDPPVRGGVPLQTDASWVEETEFELWSQGVSTLLWFGLGDSSKQTAFATAGGLYFASGAAKPAAAAFRFPFIDIRAQSSHAVLWSRAPATGTFAVQREVRGQWQTVASFPVHASEVFEVSLALPGTSVFRGVVAGVTSRDAVAFS